jgi:hypothetical protein
MEVGFEKGVDGGVEFSDCFGFCFGSEGPETKPFKFQWNRRTT